MSTTLTTRSTPTREGGDEIVIRPARDLDVAVAAYAALLADEPVVPPSQRRCRALSLAALMALETDQIGW
jgi:hypothetical protein